MEEREYDNSVLRDAASQLRAAAYRLMKAILTTGPERNHLVGEARSLLWGAEARIK